MPDVYQRDLEDLSEDQQRHVGNKMEDFDFVAHNAAWSRSDRLQTHLIEGHGFAGGPGDLEGLTEMHRVDHSVEGTPTAHLAEATGTYPHSVMVTPGPRIGGQGAETWRWRCGCGAGQGGYRTERRCRDDGLFHQQAHTRAFDAAQAERERVAAELRLSRANGFECMSETCGVIMRADEADLKGDLCANCGEQSVRLVRIEVIR